MGGGGMKENGERVNSAMIWAHSYCMNSTMLGILQMSQCVPSTTMLW
jgi:hypothetical protein